MGRACITHGNCRPMRKPTSKLEANEKLILENYNGVVETRLSWLMIGTSGGVFGHHLMNLRVP